MRRHRGAPLEPATWDDALDRIAAEFRRAQGSHGPNGGAPSSGPASTPSTSQLRSVDGVSLSPEGYFFDVFDYDALRRLLLHPLGPTGNRLVTDATVPRPSGSGDDHVIVVDPVTEHHLAGPSVGMLEPSASRPDEPGRRTRCLLGLP